MSKIDMIHGDCFVLNESIQDESIDLILTDPPYGMSFVSNIRKVKYRPIENDSNLDWLPKWISQQYRILKNNCHAYVFCSWHHIDVFKKECENAGFTVKNILIWQKPGGFIGDLEGDFGGTYEMILFLNKGRRKLNGKRIANIIKCPKTGNENHPTEKPVNLMRLLVEKSSDKGDLVLDNFFGSGATALACHETGRNFIGHEIDEERYNDAKKRVSLLLTQQTLF